MKKLVAVTTAVLVFAMAFVGCNSEGKDNEASFDTSKEITVISREEGSGTRGAFVELFEIEEKNDAGEKIDNLIASADITQSTGVMMTSVAGNEYAIGYISLGSLNDTVKAIVLGIMILPTIIGLSETSLRAVPNIYYEGSLALGASHERSVFFTVLPAAKSGVMSSIILGVGRAIGETMAVIMVAGNQAIMPQGLTKGLRTMTANIVLEMSYAQDLHREALIATAVVLFVFILIINVCFSIIKRRMS